MVRLELCSITSLDVGASCSRRDDLGSSIVKSERQQRCSEYARSDEIYGSVVAIRQDVSRRTSRPVDGYRAEGRYERKIPVAKILPIGPGKMENEARTKRKIKVS